MNEWGGGRFEIGNDAQETLFQRRFHPFAAGLNNELELFDGFGQIAPMTIQRGAINVQRGDVPR